MLLTKACNHCEGSDPSPDPFCADFSCDTAHNHRSHQTSIWVFPIHTQYGTKEVLRSFHPRNRPIIYYGLSESQEPKNNIPGFLFRLLVQGSNDSSNDVKAVLLNCEQKRSELQSASDDELFTTRSICNKFLCCFG